MITEIKSKKWEDSFEVLKEYAHDNPHISLTSMSLSVPIEYRADFYHLVSNVQVDATQDLLIDRWDDLLYLRDRCAEVKNTLVSSTNITSFNLAPALEHFVADPQGALMKPAFSVVLEGLQEGSDAVHLEPKLAEVIGNYADSLQRNAYEAWIYYSAIANLEPVKFYEVFSPDTITVHLEDAREITVGSQITSPERRLPEAVFETRDGSIYAMKSEVAHELDYYGAKITRRRDHSSGGNTVGQIAHRVLLLYRFSQLEDVSLLVDRDKSFVLQTDLMIEVLSSRESSHSGFMSWFVNRIRDIRSKNPLQIVCFDEAGTLLAAMGKDDTLPRMDVWEVGYSTSKLPEITKALITEHSPERMFL